MSVPRASMVGMTTPDSPPPAASASPPAASPAAPFVMPEGARPRRVLVTGASSGIGAATARELARRGWRVVATARRAERLEALAAETGAEPIVADLTAPRDVERLVAEAARGGTLQAVAHVAGGAIGAEPVADGDAGDWARMFDLNVLATQRLVAAVLPLLRAGVAPDACGFAHADLVAVTSTAASVTYPGGGGYSAAKAAEAALLETLKVELIGEPIRVIDVAPGMVHTDEFSAVRFRGDEAAAAAVYADVDHPLTAHDIALVIAGALELPGHVNLDRIQVRPAAQREQHALHRGPLAARAAAKAASA